MCLITFAYHTHPRYRLILAANRDEFYARPTEKMHWWEDHPDILGGRDLEARGTWMGMNKKGHFAAVTNYRDLENIKLEARSRGELPVDFLTNEPVASAYARQIHAAGDTYNGFNLLLLNASEMTHVSNYDSKITRIKPGIYGLSNALLDTPWPKVSRAKKFLHDRIKDPFELNDLITFMQDAHMAEDADLPATGLDYKREKSLSAMCIHTPEYGTCCSTALTIDYTGNVRIMEKSYPVGDREEETRSFEFQMQTARDD